ncbi:MAG: hypothetical protein INR73_27315, partial [Williamsia sp.]|nr:hypothetical protein [Williamsia sp.]
GRELCCSTWLTEFKSVNTTAARYQNLSINQTKLSGQCGRLKCCLNYELDTYLDALQHFPENSDTLQVARGTAILIKKDIFRNLMWYALKDSSKHYPLTIERVKKIKQLNAQGIAPEELEAVEVTTGKPKEVEPEFVDVVGQISLGTLERNDRKKRQQQANNQRASNQQQQGNQRSPNNPQQPRNQGQPRDQKGLQQPSQQPRQPREKDGKPVNNNRPPRKK